MKRPERQPSSPIRSSQPESSSMTKIFLTVLKLELQGTGGRLSSVKFLISQPLLSHNLLPHHQKEKAVTKKKKNAKKGVVAQVASMRP
jgi:hypothetical protein